MILRIKKGNFWLILFVESNHFKKIYKNEKI